MQNGGVAGVAVAVILAVSAVRGQAPPLDMVGLLERVADRVETYYSHVQNIICTETVRLQRLRVDFSPDGFARELEYELRVSWDPVTDGTHAPEPKILRRLRAVNGRPPRPGDEPKCLDPKPVTLDPLSFLLAEHQREYIFSLKGTGRIGRRAAVRLEYAPVDLEPPHVNWEETCFGVSLPSRTTSSVWVDAESGDVLRLDDRVRGPYEVQVPAEVRRKGGVDSYTFEWLESSIRYKAVAFRDPDETVILPESIDQISMSRELGQQRITTRFSAYQRFVTDSRIVR